jgi:hypothetical protein
MSTRSTLAMASEGQTIVHLYHEMHDDEVHLEIELEPTYICLNLVIPKPLVAGVTAILRRAEDESSK